MKMSFKERVSNAPKKKWIRMLIVNILCLLFVIWSGYYLMLLAIPFFFDCYITKYIPWGFWRKSENKTFRKTMEWVDAIVFALVAVYFINTFFFQNYQIPTSSLEKSLLVGDFLCVSKMSYGTRSPMTPFSLPLVQHTIPGINTKSYLEKPQVDYQRFKSGGEVKRYDIVVFNYPTGDTVALNKPGQDYYLICRDLDREFGKGRGREMVRQDKTTYGDIVYRPVDRRENYVKRCVGLPGETISMLNDTVFIDGKALPDPENMQLKYAVQTTEMISPMLLDELDISQEDRGAIKVKDIADYDSLKCAALGLKYIDPQSQVNYLYENVYLTQEKIEKLEKKSFVKSIVKQNLYYKRIRVIEPEAYNNCMYVQCYVYPATFRNWCEAGDFPATWIPKRGATIKFDTDVDYKVAAYQRCIENYEHNTFDYRDGKVYINGEQTDSYTFRFDYFFMMGDNRDNSLDSRAWGFVPENHVVGKPMFIWLSLDKDKGWFSGKIRWNRIFTGGNKNK